MSASCRPRGTGDEYVNGGELVCDQAELVAPPVRQRGASRETLSAARNWLTVRHDADPPASTSATPHKAPGGFRRPKMLSSTVRLTTV
jgi:hypothetical protein